MLTIGVPGPGSWALLDVVLLGTVGMVRTLLDQHRARWRGGQVVTVLCIAGTVVALLWGLLVALGAALMGALPDGFGHNIVVPPDMVLREPVWERQRVPLDEPSYRPLLSLPDAPPPPAALAEIEFDRRGWEGLRQRDIELLSRYFRSHPAWTLYEGNSGQVHARRSLDFGRHRRHWFDVDVDVVLRLGSDGESPVDTVPTASPIESSRESARDRLPLAFEPGVSTGEQATLVIDTPRIRVSLRQISHWADGRPLQAALDGVAGELQQVLAAESWHTGLLPPGSLATGQPDITLAGGRGVFEIEVVANPGEAGRVYVKAFEATRNTLVLETARRPFGWSLDGAELFRLRQSVLVHPGDPGIYYPARFEAWWAPDSGTAERKLVEALYRIDGWKSCRLGRATYGSSASGSHKSARCCRRRSCGS